MANRVHLHVISTVEQVKSNGSTQLLHNVSLRVVDMQQYLTYFNGSSHYSMLDV
jgi:hypothetical protein